jgi:tricorn protease
VTAFRCFALLAALFVTSLASAQEPIRFARTPDISPDGKLVAFSYLGDVWVVEAIGGVARPITQHEAHDVGPVFSPDGRWIAFSSNRHGQYDVFVSPAFGGKPRRLTFDSAPDMVVGWSPDGKNIVFASGRSVSFPVNTELYSVPVEGGRESKLPFQDAKDASYSADGKTVAFVRGPGTWYRKGYRGSSNDDIWIANADGSAVRRATDFPGNDSAPMLSPDGKKLYYVSEILGGQANIVVADVNAAATPAAGSPKALTQHKDDSVRKARLSGNGEWIVYECGGDLWVVGTRDGQTRKLAIEVHADEKTNTDRTASYNRDMSEYALSPDENTIAFVVHGDVFAMPTKGGKANRLTDTAGVEHGLAFSSDNKKLLFVSDRSGCEDLYLLESDDPDTSDLTRATKFKTKALTNTPEPEAGASFTPDGNRVAFIRGGKLLTMKPDGTDLKALVDTSQVIDYEWSPDGKWVAFAREDGAFASEMYLMPTDGSKPPVNVSRYATTNTDISWAGNKIAFRSQRAGGMNTHILSLQKPGSASGPGAAPPAPGDIDWEDIHLRVEPITSAYQVSNVSISKNGRMVAFTGAGDLWVASTDGGSVSRLTNRSIGAHLVRWTKGGSVYFLDGTGSLRTMAPYNLGPTTGANEPSTVNFTAKLTIRRDEEFQEVFDQSWRLLADAFYDAKHHGANWTSVREKYRPLVKNVAMKEDLYNLVSLMLGELNASHLGISAELRTPDEVTADLGLIFDESFKGPGLKIAEVLKRGPADKRGISLKAGDVVLAIDRTELIDKVNLSQLLNAKTNETVLLEVTSNPANPTARRKVEIQAVGRSRIAHLMYERWVAQNAETVAKQSGGRVGYIHIPSMDEHGLEQFVRALYSDNFDKDGIVIDVRYNGGGFTHDQVLNYLGAHEHTFFRQRDGGEGLVMRSYDRKWTKPTAVLINNRSYSDAEIFPSAYKALGLGKVVGQATGGLVIGTTGTGLIDGATFRLPKIGVYTARGINMEKEGVPPDVAVDAPPEELAKGIDAQLKKAVDVLGVDVAEWKKTHVKVAAAPSGPAVAPVAPTAPATGMPPGVTPKP